MQGRLDSPLTHAGGEQAHQHGVVLKALGVPIDAMFVSPAGRTRETAYIINSYVRSTVSYEERLLERDVGAWSGLSVTELEDAFPQAWQARLEDPFHHRPPDGENLADMTTRIEGFLSRLLESDLATVALVTHQVMSRVILGSLMELSQDQIVEVIHPNQVFYCLELSEGGRNVSHYVSGHGPFDGLLHRGDDETIRQLDRS